MSKRKEKLLPYMSHERGTYYTKVKGKRIKNLGRDKAAAFKQQSLWLSQEDRRKAEEPTFRVASAQFRKDVTYEIGDNGDYLLSPKYRDEQALILRNLDIIFGEMYPADITAPMCKKAITKIKDQSLAKARKHRKIGILLWDFMMSEGFLPLVQNPMKLIKLRALPGRDHKPTNDEFWGAYRMANERLQIAMLIARGTAMREMDILRKRLDEVTKEGIFNTQGKVLPGKKARKQFFKHNAYTKLAWSLSQKQREKMPSEYLITDTKGNPYQQHAFNSGWRYMTKQALKAGVIQKEFWFHDIRRMANNEQADPREGSKLLGNTEAVNRKHYWNEYEHVENQAAPEDIADIQHSAGIEQ